MNYLLENDGNAFIDEFFNQHQENYNLIKPLKIIMDSASFSYKEIGGLTFVLLTELLIEPENDSNFNEFIKNPDFPEQFANLAASVFELDSVDIKNRLICSITLFLDKLHLIKADMIFLEAIESLDIIQLIIDDESLDQELIDNLINSFFPQYINQ